MVRRNMSWSNMLVSHRNFKLGIPVVLTSTSSFRKQLKVMSTIDVLDSTYHSTYTAS